MINEERESIKREFERLRYPKDIQTALESNKIVLDVGWKIYKEHLGKRTTSIGHDAHLLYQMTLLKSISATVLAQGAGYVNDLDPEMSLAGDTVDVFGLWSVIRAQFEAVCTFNHVFNLPGTQNERELVHDMWQVSGLLYRQRFAKHIELEEHVEKAKSEKREIEDLRIKILQNPFIVSLDSKEQSKIESAIDRKEFQWYFKEGRAFSAAWHQMAKNMGTNELFEELYTYLSLNTHPSHVSVFQFKDLYKNKDHISITVFALSVTKVLTSFLIREYCTYFPECRDTFDRHPVEDQLLVNFYNSVFRSKEYRVNDIGDYI